MDEDSDDLYLTPIDVTRLLKVELKTITNYPKKGIFKRYSFGGRKVYY